MYEDVKPLTKRCEGLSLIRYICPAGFATIGWGHRCPTDQPPILLEQAESLLDGDLALAYTQVLALCPRAVQLPGLLGALTDFTLNLGHTRLAASTLRRVVQAGEFGRVPEELRKWVWGGGRKLPGLILRRELEILLFTKSSVYMIV